MAPHSSTLAWRVRWMEEPGIIEKDDFDLLNYSMQPQDIEQREEKLI